MKLPPTQPDQQQNGTPKDSATAPAPTMPKPGQAIIADNITTSEVGGEGQALVDFTTIKGWYKDTVESERWRKRRENDAHMLANDQWSETEKATQRERKQKRLAMNQVHRDYYLQLGRQIRSRKEPTAKPRGNGDVQTAMAITDLMRFLFDENLFDYEQTEAVKDQLVCRGWVKVFYQREDLTKEPIRIQYIPWREMRIDPLSRRYDLQDCKYVFHERWCDLDDIKAFFPSKANDLNGDQQMEWSDNFAPTGYETLSGDPYAEAVRRGDTYVANEANPDRKRAKIIECWFKKVVMAWQLIYPDGTVKLYDETNPQHVMQDAFNPNVHKVYGPHTAFFYCIYVGNVILDQGMSPYDHGMYPYFLFDAFRADVTEGNEDILPNEPFSLVAMARDPQMLINSTFTKIRHILNSRQIVMTKGIGKKDLIQQAAADPSGIIELEKFDPNDRFEFVDQLAQAGQLMNLLSPAMKQMEAATGVNEASRGMGPEQSGIALTTRQDQSIEVNTVFEDNQRRALLLIGRALMSMIQQSYTAEKIVRITEDLKDRVIAINVRDPQRAAQLQQQGVHTVYGDVTQGTYGIIIDDMDASATRREADNQLLISLLQGLKDPQMVLAMADLIVGNTEMRNRDDVIARIKMLQAKVFGPPPGSQPPQGAPPPGSETRKTLFEQIKWTPQDLTVSERAQALAQGGIQADPNGPPSNPAAEPQAPSAPPGPSMPPLIDPNKVMVERSKHLQQMRQHDHEARMAAMHAVHGQAQATQQAVQQAALTPPPPPQAPPQQ